METSRNITRKSASNLALAFALLPKARRDAMSALYAFCREVDDVADDESQPVEQRREQLAAWRSDIKKACEGGNPEFSVNRELRPVVAQYGLQFEHFSELIQGCEMDLEITRYPDFEALEEYCHLVASVVGLLSIEVFGYHNPKCRDYAIHLGRALQLTNILRDVRNDALRGRIYLPLSELTRHSVTEAEILSGTYSDRFVALGRAVADRARDHYKQARTLLPDEDRGAMVAAELMGAVYWRLLEKLKRNRFNVFQPKLTRLSKPHKACLIFGTWLRHLAGATTPAYGMS